MHSLINNDHVLLERFWETRGPQHTLYVPAAVLQRGGNTVVALELEQPNMELTAYSVAAPNFHSGQDCDPSGLPNNGTPVVMLSADSAYAHAQQWTWTGSGQIRLTANSTLCLGAGPRKDPSTGELALALALCSDTLHAGTFAWHPDTQEIVAQSGKCVDITAHGRRDGAVLELYACNGGSNQMFTFAVLIFIYMCVNI